MTEPPALLRRLKLKNLLSFGPEGIDIELRNLNVMIGPNGSGKSNLIEAISLLAALPSDLRAPIRRGGGIRDWLWQGDEGRVVSATIEAEVYSINSLARLRHRVELEMFGERFHVGSELIADAESPPGKDSLSTYYQSTRGMAHFLGKDGRPYLPQEEVDPQQSILAQLRDPRQYPQITYLSDHYKNSIAIYREWRFGPTAPARLPQRTDLPSDRLEPDFANLVMVLSRLLEHRAAKKQLIAQMQRLIGGLTDVGVKIVGNTAQLYLHEGNFDKPVPASRLSDGTLRYLCLLAILLDPEPVARLACIEEPELGLHPDSVMAISDLLIEA